MYKNYIKINVHKNLLRQMVLLSMYLNKKKNIMFKIFSFKRLKKKHSLCCYCVGYSIMLTNILLDATIRLVQF